MTLEQIEEYILRERPAACYLGRIEMQAMIDEAERCCVVASRRPISNNDQSGLEFSGVPIFEVLAKSHVGFAKNVHVTTEYRDNCIQCHHRYATEKNGLCGVCEYRSRKQ